MASFWWRQIKPQIRIWNAKIAQHARAICFDMCESNINTYYCNYLIYFDAHNQLPFSSSLCNSVYSTNSPSQVIEKWLSTKSFVSDFKLNAFVGSQSKPENCAYLTETMHVENVKNEPVANV